MTSAVLDADELPLPQRPSIEGWSENYCNHAYFPDSGIGLWSHLSRLAGPAEVWRDVLIVYLPGERFLVAKGFGVNQHSRGPGSGMLSLTCDQAWRRWTMRFSGTVRDVGSAELGEGPLRDGLHRVAELELSWLASAPVWNLGERMHGQTWAQAHYEQACRVEGSVRVGDERWNLSGAGIRDHSRGARDFGTIREHWWLTGQFPGGRSFAVLEVRNHGDEVHPLRRAYVDTGAGVVDAEVTAIEALQTAPDGTPLRTRFVLSAADGGRHEVTGRILQAMPFTMGMPNELVLGAPAADAVAPLVLSECQTEYVWDGEVGHGLTERSRTGA